MKSLINQVVNELNVENQSGAAGRGIATIVLRDLWKLSPKTRPLIEQYVKLRLSSASSGDQ